MVDEVDARSKGWELTPPVLRIAAECIEFTVGVRALMDAGGSLEPGSMLAASLSDVDAAVLDQITMRLREIAAEGGL